MPKNKHPRGIRILALTMMTWGVLAGFFFLLSLAALITPINSLEFFYNLQLHKPVYILFLFWQLIFSVSLIKFGLEFLRLRFGFLEDIWAVTFGGLFLTMLNPLYQDTLVFPLSAGYAFILFLLCHPETKAFIDKGIVRRVEAREGRQRGLSPDETVSGISTGVIIVSILQMVIALVFLRECLWSIPWVGKIFSVATRFEFLIVIRISKIGAGLLCLMGFLSALLTLRFDALGRVVSMLLGWIGIIVSLASVLLVDYSIFGEMKLFYLLEGIFIVIFCYALLALLKNLNVKRQFQGNIQGIRFKKRRRILVAIFVLIFFSFVFNVSIKSGDKKGISLVKNIFYLILKQKNDPMEEAWRDLSTQFYALAEAKKFSEAEEVGKEVLRIAEAIFGPDHPEITLSLNELAAIAIAQKKYDDAERLFKRTLDINEHILGHDHPNVAADLSNLAFLYQLKGDYENAKIFYMKAAEVYEKSSGGNSVFILKIKKNIVNLEEEQNRLRDAQQNDPNKTTPEP